MSSEAVCEHRWRKVFEESFIGGACPIGWDCVVCGWFVNTSDLTPIGLGGVITTAHKLVGPNGGRGSCSDGTTYKEQLVSEDGVLTIIR